MSVIFLYATAPDADVAAAIGEALVAEGAAACVNCIPGMTSIYRWKGRVERANEIVMIAKTTREKAAAARGVILSRHPHENPALAAIPVDAAASSSAFCAWIEEQCAPATLS